MAVLLSPLYDSSMHYQPRDVVSPTSSPWARLRAGHERPPARRLRDLDDHTDRARNRMSRSRRRHSRRSSRPSQSPPRRTAQPALASQTPAPTRLLNRVIGVLTLDDSTYQAIKRDPDATRQA